MTASDDLADIQAARCRIAQEAAILKRWAEARCLSDAGVKALDAAKGLEDWLSDDIWLAECAAVDAQQRAA